MTDDQKIDALSFWLNRAQDQNTVLREQLAAEREENALLRKRLRFADGLIETLDNMEVARAR